MLHFGHKIKLILYSIRYLRVAIGIWVYDIMNRPTSSYKVRAQHVRTIRVPFLNGFQHIFHFIADLLGCGNYELANRLASKAITAAKEYGNYHAEATAHSIRASILYKQGNPSKAETVAIHALKVMYRTQDLRGIAKITFILAQIAYSKSEFQESIQLFKKSIQLYERFKDINNILEGLSELSAVYVAMGLYPQARRILDRLLTKGTRISDREMIFITYDYADLSIMTGDLGKAAIMLQKCRYLSKKLGFRPMEAAALALQGKVEEFSGAPTSAIALMRESIEIQEAIMNKEILLDVLCHLGHLLISIGDFTNARAELNRARHVAELDGHETLLVQCDLYDLEYRLQKRELKDLGKTLDQLHERISSLDDPAMMNLILLNRIEYLVLREELHTAEEEIDSLLIRVRKQNAKLTELQVLVVKAALKTKQAAFPEAIAILEQCLAESEERNLTPFLADASNLRERVLLIKGAESLYDHADNIEQAKESLQELSSDEVAAYILRAKGIIASMGS